MQPQAKAQNRTTGNDPLERGPFVGLIAADAIAITARAVALSPVSLGAGGVTGRPYDGMTAVTGIERTQDPARTLRRRCRRHRLEHLSKPFL
jgi:hypothetical protein